MSTRLPDTTPPLTPRQEDVLRAVVERHCPDELVRMRLLQRLAPALGAVR